MVVKVGFLLSSPPSFNIWGPPAIALLPNIKSRERGGKGNKRSDKGVERAMKRQEDDGRVFSLLSAFIASLMVFFSSAFLFRPPFILSFSHPQRAGKRQDDKEPNISQRSLSSWLFCVALCGYFISYSSPALLVYYFGRA